MCESKASSNSNRLLCFESKIAVLERLFLLMHAAGSERDESGRTEEAVGAA
jgi:hypothetical protein